MLGKTSPCGKECVLGAARPGWAWRGWAWQGRARQGVAGQGKARILYKLNDIPAINHPWQWYGGHSYAQHGDDLIALNIFHRIGIERPSYLDIGAFHPFIISNTALLYERGCRGINVEPNAHLIEAFKVHRPGDTNLNLGVGPKRCIGKFYVANPLSGRNSFIRSVSEEAGHGSREVEVEMVTVEEIIADYANGVSPDFLTVDAEGYDLAILRSMHHSLGHGPKVICAEMITEKSDDSIEIKGLMLRSGYFPYAWAGSNMFFIRDEFLRKVY